MPDTEPGNQAFLKQLQSSSPKVRMEAARSLAGELSQADRKLVLAAIQHEPIPQIRTLLEKALSEEPDARAGEVELQVDDQGSGVDLGKLILHEMSQAIGRVALEAAIADPNYSGSELERAINRMDRRTVALAKIADSRRGRVEKLSVNLLESVQAATAIQTSSIVVEATPESAEDSDFNVETDPDLVAMLLEAAINNACQAQSTSGSDLPVVIEVNSTNVSCSILITNKFAGSSIEKAQVMALGRTTRFGGRGTGMSVVAGAADGLGVEWDFRGVAGTATFSVRFER